MEERSTKIPSELLPATFGKQGEEALQSIDNTIQILLRHHKLPEDGWNNASIQYLLGRIAMMDSNNFLSGCSLGEREGRIASDLVLSRHYNLTHGIGRSGVLTESQPKAVGSSLMYKVTQHLLEDLLTVLGIEKSVKCILLPLCTGMSLMMCLIALRKLRSKAQYVVWSRCDQKSCFKAILSAGFKPLIVDTIWEGEQLVTDYAGLVKIILEVGVEEVLCVLSTTSCFAPRSSDNVENIAKVCKTYEIPHVINNAFGLQSRYLLGRIQKAKRVGRVDLFLQSTDKNLLVPVGGCIVCSFEQTLLDAVSSSYAGRASASPVIDVFITLLSLGKSGYRKLLEEQKESYSLLQTKMQELALSVGEKVLNTHDNPISIAFTLKNIKEKDVSMLGSMLYLRMISGTRVISSDKEAVVEGYTFKGWGGHTSDFRTPYLTAAAAIGTCNKDIDKFINKLQKVISTLTAKQNVQEIE